MRQNPAMCDSWLDSKVEERCFEASRGHLMGFSTGWNTIILSYDNSSDWKGDYSEVRGKMSAILFKIICQ